MDKKKVLLVEDNKDDILLVQRTFEKTKLSEKFELIVTQDGTEALSYLHNNGSGLSSQMEKPSLILLLDLNLPRMNGFEILQHIRNNETTKFIPVIIFTSSKEDQDITKSYRLGANSFVRKPIDSKTFTSVIQQIVQYWTDVNEIPGK